MSNLKKWLPLVILVALIIVSLKLGLREALSLEKLQAQKIVFQNYTADNPLLSGMIFAAAYAASVALSLPLATLLTLLGGFLFGKWLGTFIVVLSATIGATIIFVIARTSLGTTLRDKAGGLYKKVEKNMQDNAVGYMLFMRLVPVFPFFLVNILPALFNVSLRNFALTTFFGIIPGSFVYVNLGQELGNITTLGDLISRDTLIAFGLLGFFALIPTLYKQWRTHRSKSAAILFALILGSTANSAMADEYKSFLSLYDGLLAQYVESNASYNGITFNAVHYDKWHQDPRHAEARRILLATNPQKLETKAEKLSFWINTYNFLTIDLITREKETQSIKNLGGFLTSPWKKHSWEIAGTSYTLDHIEHSIIRPLGEPRIHFAINCAAISCPDLRPEAYRAHRLETQLAAQTALTLANPTKGFKAHENDNHIQISKIMNWFAVDFNKGDIKSWLQKYKPQINAQTEIDFLAYDWALNIAR